MKILREIVGSILLVESDGYFHQVKAEVYENKRRLDLENKYQKVKQKYQESRSEANWDELQEIEKKLERTEQHYHNNYKGISACQLMGKEEVVISLILIVFFFITTFIYSPQNFLGTGSAISFEKSILLLPINFFINFFSNSFLGYFGIADNETSIEFINQRLESNIFSIFLVEPNMTMAKVENITMNQTEENTAIEDNNLTFWLKQQIPDLTIEKNSDYNLNLEDYFEGAESYEIQEVENISFNLTGSILTIIPEENFTGTREARIEAIKTIKITRTKEENETSEIGGENITLTNNELMNLTNATDIQNITNEINVTMNITSNETISNVSLGVNETIETNYKRYIVKLKEKPIIEKIEEEKDKIDYYENKSKEIKAAGISSIYNYPLKLYYESKTNGLINSFNETIREHSDTVEEEHDSFKEKISNLAEEKITGQAINDVAGKEIILEFKEVFNGVALNLSDRELNNIKDLPEVGEVYLDLEVKANLMDSVPLIGADKVWQLDADGNNCAETGKDCLTGKGTTIAVIDTGVDYTHPDLGGCFGTGCKVIGGYDFNNKDSNPIDDNGHGTHCAGIAAGNGILKGVAPDAKILAYKVLNAAGSGYMSNIIAGIERAADPNQDKDFSDHADVISMSLGTDCFGFYTANCGPEDSVSGAVDNAVDVGIVVVISAGNSGPNFGTIGSPGTARKAITVGAVDKSGIIASFSSRGPVLEEIKPDVVAPGVLICAARMPRFEPWTINPIYQQCLDEKHVLLSGTSMAAPHVAGAAALLKQSNPTLTSKEIKEKLMQTSVDKGYDAYTQGAGEIDILKSVSVSEKVSLSPSFLGIGENIGTKMTMFQINLQDPALKAQTFIVSALISGNIQTEVSPKTINVGSTILELTFTSQEGNFKEGIYTGIITLQAVEDSSIIFRLPYSLIIDFSPPDISNIVQRNYINSGGFLQGVTWHTDDISNCNLFYRKSGESEFRKRESFGLEHILNFSDIKPGNYEYYITAENRAGLISIEDNQGKYYKFIYSEVSLIPQTGFDKAASFDGSDQVFTKWPELDFNQNGRKEFIFRSYMGNWESKNIFMFYENQEDNKYNNIFKIEINSPKSEDVSFRASDIGDSDNDGFRELLTYGRIGNDFFIRIYEQSNLTSYPDSISWQTSGEWWPVNAKIEDLDGDGKKEIIVAGDFCDFRSVCIYENNGDNSFNNVYQTSFSSMEALQSMETCDIDGDGKKEIIVAGIGSPGVKDIYVLKNNGDNSYYVPWSSDVPYNQNLIKCLDDSDNLKSKFIVGGFTSIGFSLINGYSDLYHVFGLNDKNSLEEVYSFVIRSGLDDSAINSLDIDGDGRKEIALIVNTNTFYLLDDFDTGFKPLYYHSFTGVLNHGIGVGDYDQDLKPEIIFNEYSNTVIYESNKANTCIDADGDNYNSTSNCGIVDCNDNDASINPGAKEICDDGKDNDCDGKIDKQDEYCQICGDNVIESGEACDPPKSSKDCVISGYKGSQICSDDCLSWSSCNSDEYCGDKIKNGNEKCDGKELKGETCISQGFKYGELSCMADCSGFDTSNCLNCVDDDKDGYDNCNIGETGDDGKVKDCDDNNANINPGMSDSICNGIDDNCDGKIDEGYAEKETKCGTGICSGNTGLLECANGKEIDSCNPFKGAIAETCDNENGYDGIDNNCDGKIDLDCSNYCDKDGDGHSPNLVCLFAGYKLGDCDDNNAVIWQNLNAYLDKDGDGFGAGNAIQLCLGDAIPLGYSDNNKDCNDNNAEINPNAAEICDGIDNNCDGKIDENNGDCQNNYCSQGKCVECINNVQCDDNLFCNGQETCVAGKCEKRILNMDDNIACTSDFCDEETDKIVHVPDDNYCSDKLWCNGEEYCDLKLGCQIKNKPDCNDKIDCILDSCDENNDLCKHDASKCQCIKDADCDDKNPCTDDTCNQFICKNTPNDKNSCDDGLWCTENDKCSNGKCTSSLKNIDDGKDCTVDSCDEENKTIAHVSNNNLCSNSERCDASIGCVLQTCEERKGYICLGGEYCSGNYLVANDTNRCCSENCILPAWSSCLECGKGLFNLCDKKECESILEGCYFTATGLSGICKSCSDSICENYGNALNCLADCCKLDCKWNGISCIKEKRCPSYNTGDLPKCIDILCTEGVFIFNFNNSKCDDNNDCTIDSCTKIGCDYKINESDKVCLNKGQKCEDVDNDGVLDYDPQFCPMGTDRCIEKIEDLTKERTNQLNPVSSLLNINFNETETINNLSNVKIYKIGVAEIEFKEKIKLINVNETGCFAPLNIDPLFELGDKKIKVYSQDYSGLNKAAQVKMYNVSFNSPKIKKDGENCPDTICKIINYNKTGGSLTIEFAGFSEYEVVEGEYCGDGVCQADETCSSCSGDCGACPVTPLFGGSSGGSGGGGGSTSVKKDTISNITKQDNNKQGQVLDLNNETNKSEEGTEEPKLPILEKKSVFDIILLSAIILAVIVVVIIFNIFKIRKISSTSEKERSMLKGS